MSTGVTEENWLLCRVGPRLCALPLGNVIETMRPLPVDPFADAPAIVRGLCLVRGAPIVVLDLGRLFSERSSRPGRMVTVTLGDRVVGILVASVLGVRLMATGMGDSLPPLLRDVAGDAVSAVGTLDAELLLFLNTSRMVSPDVLDDLDREGTNG